MVFENENKRSVDSVYVWLDWLHVQRGRILSILNCIVSVVRIFFSIDFIHEKQNRYLSVRSVFCIVRGFPSFWNQVILFVRRRFGTNFSQHVLLIGSPNRREKMRSHGWPHQGPRLFAHLSQNAKPDDVEI